MIEMIVFILLSMGLKGTVRLNIIGAGITNEETPSNKSSTYQGL